MSKWKLVYALGCFVALPALAAPPQPALYAQGGYRFGATIKSDKSTQIDQEDGPAWGMLVQLPTANDAALEVLASSGASRVDVTGQPQLGVTHLLFGGIKYIERGSTEPFVGFALGLSYFELDGTDDRFRPAWALYGGFEWPLARHLRLRAEVRWVGVYFDSETTFECRTGCSVRIAPGTWSEAEALVGLGLQF